jgi:hypothetical protein
MTRARAEEYRRLAQECLVAARSASTEEARNTLLEMARNWFRLAQEQDHENANVKESAPPLAAAEPQPVAQQQQQIQPKDDEDKKE